MAWHSWKLTWGRVAHPALRVRALTAAFVVASVALFPAPPTNAGEEGPEPPALVEISEWMSEPPENQSEAAGEWVELAVTAAGSLAGISITDNDGAVDFAFANGSSAQAGDLLIIHNGNPTPAAPHGPGTHYFANKTSWSFDNGGDDLEVISASGATLDWFAFGNGSAVDARGESGAAFFDRAPSGSTLARVQGEWTAAAPTPGRQNVALQGSQERPPLSTAWVSAPDPIHFILCNMGGGPWVSHGWQVKLGSRAYPMAVAQLAEGACIVFGTATSSSVAGAIGQEFGNYLAQDAAVDGIPSGSTVELRDPWGAASSLDAAPEFDGLEGQSPVLWEPCACPQVWKPRALLDLPSMAESASASNVSIVDAGGNLSRAVLSLIERAVATLDLNMYLLTSREVMDALTQAGVRAVRVRVLLEGSPTGIARRDAMPTQVQLQALEAAGVELRATASGPAAPTRDHAKYLVADDERIMILTENLVGAALSDHTPNTGFGTSFRSASIARQLRALFEWDFSSASALTNGSAVFQAPRVSPGDEAAPEGASAAQLAISPLPSGHWEAWVQLIGGAHTEVVCAALSADAAVLGPEGPVGQALLSASARNVSVKVLLATPASNDSKNGTADAARLLAGEAAARNLSLEVRLDPRGADNESKMHAKVLVVDRQRFLMGSHNLVMAAAVANREVSIMMESAPAAEQLALSLLRVFHQAISMAVEGVTFDSAQSYGQAPVPQTVVQGLMAHPFYWILGPGALFAAWGGLRDRRRRRAKRIHFSAFWLGVAIARSLFRPRRRRPLDDPPAQDLREILILPESGGLQEPARPATLPLPPSAFDLMERE